MDQRRWVQRPFGTGGVLIRSAWCACAIFSAFNSDTIMPRSGAKGGSTKKAKPSTEKKRGAIPGAAPKADPHDRPVRLLAGGNPQIAKADGDAPVQAYIAAIPGWKKEIARRLDAIITRTVPEVRKAVKWNSPLYGIDGRGWFLGIHVYTHYVKVAFFKGTSLRPVPPGDSTSKDTRYLNIRESDDLDEVQLARWVKQAAALPGWGS